METQNGSCDSSTVVDQNNTNNNQQQQMAAVVDEYEGCDESSELELGLALSLGGCPKTKINNKHFPRIFTSNNNNNNNNNCLKNNDDVVGVVSPPSSASSCSSLGLRTCTKNNKSCVNNNNDINIGINISNNINDKNSKNVSAGSKRAASPTALSQVVGWPPIRSYRMNSMANAKLTTNDEHNSHFDATKGETRIFDEDKNANSKDKMPHKGSLFVKANMDGVAIGRKVDLTAHSSYESLAQILEDMFTNNPAEESNAEELILLPKVTRVTRPSKLLDGKSDFVLTYEDKDGDWMLVGDVPWGMFVSSVKRLKIMRTSEANGLAPRSEDRSSKHRRRPI